MATSVEPTTSAADDDRPVLTPQRIRMLAIVGAVLAAVLLVVWFVREAGSRKEAFATTALETARATAEQGNLPLAVQQFEQVTQQYAGTAAAHEATLGMVQARLVNEQNELAISTLTEFIGSNPPATYAAPANGLLGTAYENTSRFREALAAYQEAARIATTGYLKASYLLDAGRAARLSGDTAQATAIYRDIIANHESTAAKTEAEVRLAEMTRGVL